MSESGATSRATTRVRGAPNKDQYDKVKAKYKTFDKNAKTECARVEALHATKPFTPTGNPVEYAILYGTYHKNYLYTPRLQKVNLGLRPDGIV